MKCTLRITSALTDEKGTVVSNYTYPNDQATVVENRGFFKESDEVLDVTELVFSQNKYYRLTDEMMKELVLGIFENT